MKGVVSRYGQQCRVVAVYGTLNNYMCVYICMHVQTGTLPEITHYHDGLLIIFSPGWRLLGQNYSCSPGSHMYEAQGVLPAPPPPGLHMYEAQRVPSPSSPKTPQTNGAEFTKAHPAVTARTNWGQSDSSLPAVYIQLRYYGYRE